MNILNDKYALVTPPRCGTRWVLGLIHESLNIGLKQTHTFNMDLLGDRKILMMVRNPYHRLRSIFRWKKTINAIHSNVTWEEFVFSQNHPSITEHYSENIDKVFKFIKLEEVHQQIQDILGITLPKYNNEYFDKKHDDGLIFKEAYNNPKILHKVNEQFKLDFDKFGYNIINKN